MDHSDPHRVKYFWEALTLKYNFSYSWEVPRPLTPLDPYRGGGGGNGGVIMRGVI